MRREEVVADLPGHRVAPAAEIAGPRHLVPMVPQDRQPPQRFGQRRPVPTLLGGRDRGLVTLDRFAETAGVLPFARLAKQVRRGTPLADEARTREAGRRSFTRRRHSPRSV